MVFRSGLFGSVNTKAVAAGEPPTIHYRTVEIQGVKIFYREAGNPSAPAVLLLHGYPTSSFMYRNLIPLLADRYHVVAPDLPGFGFSDTPDRGSYHYTFDQLAATMDAFTDAVGLHRYAMEVFDYGAPVGWRLAVAHPERITAIVTQNGNAYEEGLSNAWNPIQKYWQDPSEANRAALREFLTPATTRWQYVHGVPDEFHPPLLAVWGKNDPFFLPAGAEAFRRDIPGAEVHFYDTGHFALETNLGEIGAQIHRFLDRHVSATAAP